MERRAYRTIGWVVLGLSLGYVVTCVPLMLDRSQLSHYDSNVAIGIATVAFTELALAIQGVISARRTRAVVVEAIRLTNLAGAFILLVLTQAALLSISDDGASTHYTGLTGVILGAAAALTGIYMVQHRPGHPR
ncbi:hypothetical protein GCM10010435_84410 [Winogradskya consettensis]|uniref:Uncharacterized protein n=1 Tax=Winogradskya consettensis TaxID=113560 RepID=A0A919T253_9ACTN|nr:hypothetical protein [Actinoplanes consettensis]GIM82061.1 hypothetical protein Aco04nite_79690 [Actinoplanes consettensis]